MNRKRAYEEKHPETKHGRHNAPRDERGRLSRNFCDLGETRRFTNDTAEKTGLSERTIQLQAHRAEVLGNDMLDRIKAERRLGELIQGQKETVGLANGGDAQRTRFQKSTELNRPTLADVGIDKKLSSRAQKPAAVHQAIAANLGQNSGHNLARDLAALGIHREPGKRQDFTRWLAALLGGLSAADAR